MQPRRRADLVIWPCQRVELRGPIVYIVLAARGEEEIARRAVYRVHRISFRGVQAPRQSSASASPHHGAPADSTPRARGGDWSARSKAHQPYYTSVLLSRCTRSRPAREQRNPVWRVWAAVLGNREIEHVEAGALHQRAGFLRRVVGVEARQIGDAGN